jgi:hypothetical protein
MCCQYRWHVPEQQNRNSGSNAERRNKSFMTFFEDFHKWPTHHFVAIFLIELFIHSKSFHGENSSVRHRDTPHDCNIDNVNMLRSVSLHHSRWPQTLIRHRNDFEGPSEHTKGAFFAADCSPKPEPLIMGVIGACAPSNTRETKEIHAGRTLRGSEGPEESRERARKPSGVDSLHLSHLERNLFPS